jgi:hypothetical protein
MTGLRAGSEGAQRKPIHNVRLTLTRQPAESIVVVHPQYSMSSQWSEQMCDAASVF